MHEKRRDWVQKGFRDLRMILLAKFLDAAIARSLRGRAYGGEVA